MLSCLCFSRSNRRLNERADGSFCCAGEGESDTGVTERDELEESCLVRARVPVGDEAIDDP